MLQNTSHLKAVVSSFSSKILCGRYHNSYKTIFVRYFSNKKPTINIFDRKTKTHQKNVAARIPNHHVYDYIKNEVAERLADRLADVSRFFPKALDLGAGKGFLARHISKDEIGKLYQLESANELLRLCEPSEIEVENYIVDEEIIPFNDNEFDLILSSLSLQWVNDLPGVFSQVKTCLKDDGAFMATIFGTDTLYELRCALQVAETEREGGFGPHVSPFTEMKDIGGLLQQAGLNLTTIDFDEIVIDYPSIFELMEDLKAMGENNATWTRKSILHRDTLFAAASIYKEIYGNEDGSIPATFQILYMIGWKPSKTQPKPLKRGSATANFQELAEITSKE